MQEDLLSTLPEYKLYKGSAIYIGTFIGGPLVAGYMASENFKKIGQKNQAKKAWIIAIIATLAILGAAFYASGLEKVPNYVIPLLYTGIAQFLIQRFQGNAIKTHVEKGGQLYSAWRGVGVGLIGCVVLLTVIYLTVLLTDKSLLQGGA